jgi:hypothetical protein
VYEGLARITSDEARNDLARATEAGLLTAQDDSRQMMLAGPALYPRLANALALDLAAPTRESIVTEVANAPAGAWDAAGAG